MEKLTKGSATKQFIIAESRRLFNENGLSLTLGELAAQMGVTIGKITNHFRTKDHLIVGLSDAYEYHIGELVKSFPTEGGVTLTKLANSMEKVMQLQYEHRCLLLFVCGASLDQDVLIQQISEKWSNNLTRFKEQLASMIDGGILDESALEPANFEVLKFQYFNLLTTWLVSQTLYNRGKPLSQTKKIYIKGVLLSFYPYLTRKGKAELAEVVKGLQKR